ncbi:hypothetical protein [Brevibacillus sp. AF8]|uniref:hypothetical protein n=1 Tax=Brevibacillus sp. AF8 TaxID=2825881 RepID=UPI001E3B705A|nr:hypothetical protein [Brevibacillus sp. AF8]MCE0453037.1 hypothetical protein [Brevibacillus sp. AF8]
MKLDLKNIKDINKARNKTLFSGCIHKDKDCNNSISKAHSIQNNGILNRLARNGNVMAFDFSKIPSNHNIILNEVGRGKASTFTGFCNNHDSKIFKPIEQFDYSPKSAEQNYLFAYRAFALGYYERHSSYKLLESRINEHPTSINSELGERYLMYTDHLKYLEKLKVIMNTNLDNLRYDRISTDLIIWPNEYGIASTSMFFISYDNEGRLINNQDSYISPFFFTIFPQSGMTYVLMSYFSKDKSMYQFIKKQIIPLSESEQKATISNLIALYIENIFFSPDYWDTIPNETKDKYYRICRNTMGRKKPKKLTEYRDFNLFI